MNNLFLFYVQIYQFAKQIFNLKLLLFLLLLNSINLIFVLFPKEKGYLIIYHPKNVYLLNNQIFKKTQFLRLSIYNRFNHYTNCIFT